jgi:hypothetical protein
MYYLSHVTSERHIRLCLPDEYKQQRCISDGKNLQKQLTDIKNERGNLGCKVKALKGKDRAEFQHESKEIFYDVPGFRCKYPA